MDKFEEIVEAIKEKHESVNLDDQEKTEYSDHTEYTDYTDCVLIS